MATAVHFYHLTKTPLEKALPALLLKAYQGRFRVLLTTANEEQRAFFNHQLWTFSQKVFLPHGDISEQHPERQPILLAGGVDNRNDATICVTIDGTTLEEPEAFERVLDVFDGTDTTATAEARSRWQHYKQAGYSLVYHRQTEAGSWQAEPAASSSAA